MAKRLKDKGLKIDRFVSSPAKRARSTAKYFAKEYDVKKDDIRLVEELYMASPAAFAEAIAMLDNAHDTVALFAHNPGISEFAATLTEVKPDDMPTCAIFAVEVDTSSWS